MREGGGLMTHKVPMTIPLLWLWRLIHLCLHVGHRLGHVGEQLRLSSKELLHPCRWWRWRWCMVVLLVRSLVVVLHVVVFAATSSSLA